MLDAKVIVIGGGPGGSAAAKKCAEHGLKTLLLEKKKLPRVKVCAAMLFMNAAVKLIEQEFGEIPSNAIGDPARFSGETLVHIPGGLEVKTKTGKETPSILRSSFDYWLNEKARDKGVELRDNAMVTSITEESDGCIVEVEKEGKKQKLKSKFIIGADGATSMVRRYLYPDIKPRFTQCYHEWYEGGMDQACNLDRQIMHGFMLPPECGLPHSTVALYQKGAHFVLDIDTRMGDIKKSIAEGKRAIKDYGIDLPQPVYKDAALIPSLYKELFSGTFVPARGNILLVGDAGGLLVPVSGEGIGTAMISGLSAATAVVRAVETGEKAENYYLEDINDMLSKFKQIYPLRDKLRESALKGKEAVENVFDEVFDLTDRVFQV